jgi:hypothetical protein
MGVSNSPSANFIKPFFFISGKLLQPSTMFVDKVRTLRLGGTPGVNVIKLFPFLTVDEA